MNTIIWDYKSVWPYVWPQNKCSSLDLYFMVKWFCLISWRLISVRTSLFGIMSQYDLKFGLKINIGHCDLYFIVQYFVLYLETIWCMNIILWDYGSVWPDVWPQNKCRSIWPIFHGPVILSYISKTVWCVSVIISDNETMWPKLWPQSKYMSTWPVCYGLVIWLNIVTGWLSSTTVHWPASE